MFKRIGLFILTNILVVVAINILLSVFGVKPYLSANGINYQSLLVFCLLWGAVGSFISLQMSRFMAKRMMNLELVTETGQYGKIVRRVYEMAKEAGITKMPEVAVYQSEEVNAFATGPSKNRSLIAVSTGLLENMSEDEVEGVLAHEISHAANGDMVTMALVQGVVNAFVMFASRAATFAIDQVLRGDDEEGEGLGMFAHFAVVMVLDIAFGILAAPIVCWFSRYREFKADNGSAYLVGKHKMIAALKALQNTKDRLEKAEPQMASMKISSKESMLALFSTHPSLEKRIAALESTNF